MNVLALFWIMTGSMLGAFVAAVAARSLHSFSRHELAELCRASQAPERFADILRRHDRIAIGVETMVALLVALAVCSGSVWIWAAFAEPQERPWPAFVAAAAVLGLVVAAITVWLPCWIARMAAARFLFRSWPMWQALDAGIRPLAGIGRMIDVLLHRLVGRTPPQIDEESIEEEIRTIISEGHREGLLEGEAREMIEGVFELGDATVSHIMTPRTEIHMLPAGAAWDEILESIIDSGHTRIPVYNKSRDDIVGLLYSKDLLPELAKGPDQPRRPLAKLLRKPLFVPETKPVDDLLKLFQKTRTHIAVVLDEYGGVSGLVSIEDVLEEIVGEIEDEYDETSEIEIRQIDGDVCEALGRAHVDEINELMGFELPEEDEFDTIGGFVFAEFGRVPTAGESIIWQDAVRVIVLDASYRRVNRVRLERVRQQSLETA